MILAQIHYDPSSNQLQVIMRTSLEIPRILSQNVQNNLEGQNQWPLFSIPAERIPGWMFGASLVIWAKICDKLSARQVKFPRILSQNSQNDLEDQGQRPPFSIPHESIPWCMFGANMVIPAQICDELSCIQGQVYRQTDRRRDRETDEWTQTTTIPLWPEKQMCYQ